MARKTGARILVTLQCTECRSRNYHTEKNRRNDPDRLQFVKFCRRCRCRHPHRETR